MTLGTDQLLALVSEVRLGVPKAESRFAADPDFDEAWDSIQKTIDDHPTAIIEIPGELS